MKNNSSTFIIPAHKSETIGIKYLAPVTKQKAMPIYFEVLDSAKNYIDTFAVYHRWPQANKQNKLGYPGAMSKLLSFEI